MPRWAAMPRQKRLPPPQLAINVRRFRKRRGFTLEQLAARVGLSTMKMIETGHSAVSIHTLMDLASALDCTLDELLFVPEDPLPPALMAFLKSPSGQDATAEEVEALRRVRAYGRRPTEASYYLALQMLRSMHSGQGEDKR